jgi:D-glycero-D-manno-heptose 1,7-bisphosphate phosphatase
MNPKLIIFDADGTLVETISGATFRKGADDWQWLPGRLEKLHELKRQGVRLAVVTNQGGVAYGYMTKDGILSELLLMIKEAGIPIGGLYVCYTHPKATLPQYRIEDVRRKPGPGMLREAMADFEADPSETLYVGDRPEDEQAARAVGISFMWAEDFFK